MIFGLYKILGAIGAVIGGILGLRVCRSFTWFGTFSGIIGQHILFTVVGALIGATVLSAPIRMLFRDTIDAELERQAEEDGDYDYYDEEDEEDGYEGLYGDDEYDDDDDGLGGQGSAGKAEKEDGNGQAQDAGGETVAQKSKEPQPEKEAGEAQTGTEYGQAQEDSAAQDWQSAGYPSKFDYLMDQEASDIVFTENDLEGLSPQELTYLRNSIYAYRGYIFQSQELNDYFSRYTWYEPDPSVTTEGVSLAEEENAKFIREYQERNGLMYKPE